ncbi:MAG: hypothetical protein WBM98_05955 [Maribacter sp.]|uniref:hypothetical protein n=1 Tax=Maribacter sp. TaxID=1897614 RepID=UPI003C725E33
MIIKKLFVLLFVFCWCNGYSQENLNTYKYFIVPKKLDAFKKENQYKTSTLIKYLFTKNGFTAVYDDALPEDLEKNRCLGLLVSVNDESSMFTTKTAMILKDCASKTILTTVVGSSKEKDFESAYRESFTEAFATIKAMDYNYTPPEMKQSEVIKNSVPMETTKHPKNSVDQVVVKQEATPETQLYKNTEPVATAIEKAVPVEKEVLVREQMDANMLYAQEIPGGFQLVDSSPKIKLKLYRTSIPDVYTVTYEKDNGVVFKKDGTWYLEYYLGGQLISEVLNIKF